MIWEYIEVIGLGILINGVIIGSLIYCLKNNKKNKDKDDKDND